MKQTIVRFGRLRRTSGLLLAGVVLLVGCSAPQPVPTAASLPSETAAPATDIPATITRTPLPSVTPTLTSTPIPPTATSLLSAAITQTPATATIQNGTQNGAQNTVPPTRQSTTVSGLIAAAVSAMTSTAPSALPTATSALLGITPQIGLTPLPTVAAILPGGAPPLEISLPAGWKHGYQILPTRSELEERSMNLAVYQGPVKGGTGTIYVLWGFPSLGPPPTDINPLEAETAIPGTLAPDLQSQMLYSDGFRLLQGTILDITCNMGNFGQQDFTVGGIPATGEYFAASQCQGEPDTAGWFAGLNQYNGNYLFYVTIDPVEAYNDARPDVQKILDTVVFRSPTGATQDAAGAAGTPAMTTTPALQ